MNTRTFFALIAIGLVSLLTGCATVAPPHEEPGVTAPSTYKGEAYYKNHLKDVIAKAETGDVASQYEVSFVLGWRGDIKSNFWLEKAAAQNYLPAVAMLGARHFRYSTNGYSKDDAMAERLCYRAYEIYLSKPASEWDVFETMMAAHSLRNIAEYHMSDKDKAQDLLCKAQKMGVTEHNLVWTLNDDLKKIGRTCK